MTYFCLIFRLCVNGLFYHEAPFFWKKRAHSDAIIKNCCIKVERWSFFRCCITSLENKIQISYLVQVRHNYCIFVFYCVHCCGVFCFCCTNLSEFIWIYLIFLFSAMTAVCALQAPVKLLEEPQSSVLTSSHVS